MCDSQRTPMPPGAWKRSILPGQGRKRSGSSALIRHSTAWPRILMSSCLKDSG
ncbi:Uncharacterised protein [Vibrio cholerae]|nr:Uncharacterised protein [Vibrio cholerae]